MSHVVQRLVVVSGLFLFAFQVAADSVNTYPAAYAEVDTVRELDGVIEAVNQATISAQTTGRVTRINVDVDDYVTKGDVLITFRDKKIRSAFNAAQANLDEAEKEYSRIKGIYEKKLIAKAVLDKAEARYKSTQAQLAEAKEALENTIVRAPYSGIVVKRHIEVGELAQPGRALLTGLSLEALRVRVNVPQNIIVAVRKYSQAQVIFQQAGKQPNSVIVNDMRISPFAEPETHTFEIKANLPNADYGVYPGMFIKVAFVTGKEKHLLIPAESVTRRSEVNAVYILDDEKQLHYRQVRIGKTTPDGKKVEVLAGLTEGEQVVIDPVDAAVQLKRQGKH